MLSNLQVLASFCTPLSPFPHLLLNSYWFRQPKIFPSKAQSFIAKAYHSLIASKNQLTSLIWDHWIWDPNFTLSEWESIAAKHTGEEYKAYGPADSQGEIYSANQSFLYLVMQVLWKATFIHCPLHGHYPFQGDRNRHCSLTNIEQKYLMD